MSFRFYITTQIGDGLSTRTAFASKLQNYIANDGTKDFGAWANRATAFRFCLADCSSALHATIAADADIIALSPELADGTAITAYLDGLVGTLPGNVVTALELARVPVDWVNVGTTRRELWRFIYRWHVVVHWLNDNPNAHNFLKTNLNSTVGSIPVARRNAVQNWMSGRAIDTSWITGATTIRAVVRFIIQNGNFPALSHGPVNF